MEEFGLDFPVGDSPGDSRARAKPENRKKTSAADQTFVDSLPDERPHTSDRSEWEPGRFIDLEWLSPQNFSFPSAAAEPGNAAPMIFDEKSLDEFIDDFAQEKITASPNAFASEEQPFTLAEPKLDFTSIDDAAFSPAVESHEAAQAKSEAGEATAWLKDLPSEMAFLNQTVASEELLQHAEPTIAGKKEPQPRKTEEHAIAPEPVEQLRATKAPHHAFEDVTLTPDDAEALTDFGKQPRHGNQQPSARFHLLSGWFQKFTDKITDWSGNLLVGIDLGSQYFKYVAFQNSGLGLGFRKGGSYKLHSYECVSVPLAPADASEEQKRVFLQERVREFLANKLVRKAWVTTAVDGIEVVFRHLMLPRMQKKDLAEAVPWATRKDLPFDVASSTLDYELLGTRKEGNAEKMEVIAIAAPDRVVADHLSLLRDTGVSPLKISTIPLALWNLLTLTHAAENENVLMIEIGARTTNLAFINCGRLQFVRAIAMAGDALTEALTNTFFIEGHAINLSAGEAERIKREYGFPLETETGSTSQGIPLVEIGVQMRPALESLLTEIHRSIDYYREKFKVETIHRILLTGGGSRLKNLPEYLHREIGLAVDIFNPLAKLGATRIVTEGERENSALLEGLGPQLTVAIGLALDKRPALNLLPAEMKGALRLHTVRKVFHYLATLVLAAIVISTAWIYLKSEQFKADRERLKLEYKKIEPHRNQYLQLAQKAEALQSRLAAYEKNIDIRLTTARHLKAISNLVPEMIALTSLSIGPSEGVDNKNPGKPQSAAPPDSLSNAEVIILQGLVRDRDAKRGVNLAHFLIDLEKAGYFQSIALAEQQLQQDGILSFTLECRY